MERTIPATPTYSGTQRQVFSEMQNMGNSFYQGGEKRLKPSENQTEVLDLILKSLETPKVGQNNGASMGRGKCVSRMGELRNPSQQESSLGQMMRQCQQPQMQQYIQQPNSSIRSSRRVSPQRRIDVQTPLAHRGAYEALEMITSAAPARARGSRPTFNVKTEDEQFGFDPSLQYLPAVPGFNFKEDDSEYAQLFGDDSNNDFGNDDFEFDQYLGKRGPSDNYMIGKAQAVPPSASRMKLEQGFVRPPSSAQLEQISLRDRYERESAQLMQRHEKKSSKRGAARPPVIKEGDWLCPDPNCCNVNWSKRTKCNLCGVHRPHVSAVKKRPYMLTKLYEANTWSCPKCKNIINASHTFCGVCGEHRTEDIEKGLDIVQRHLQQKKDTHKGPISRPAELDIVYRTDKAKKAGGFSRAEPMPTQPIMEDPYSSGRLFERNLKRNFGSDYLQQSANWFKSTEAKN